MSLNISSHHHQLSECEGNVRSNANLVSIQIFANIPRYNSYHHHQFDQKQQRDCGFSTQ